MVQQEEVIVMVELDLVALVQPMVVEEVVEDIHLLIQRDIHQEMMVVLVP